MSGPSRHESCIAKTYLITIIPTMLILLAIVIAVFIVIKTCLKINYNNFEEIDVPTN